MSNLPDWLPPIIDLAGSYEEIIERLYKIFHRDFIETRAKHLEIEVHYDGVIDEFSQGKVNGFWHVITRQDNTGTNRLIDYRRAERLPWAKPLMKNPHRDEIKFFIYDEGRRRKGIRHYIWFEKGDYVVILKRRKYDFFWITAFYVDDWHRENLQRKFKNRTRL